MKPVFIIAFILFAIQVSFSQNQFNVILEDSTNAHISNSVIFSEGNYYILSGTGNELGIRSICISKVSEEGNIQWKEIYGCDSIEIWEGWNHCMKKSENNIFLTTTIKSINTEKNGFMFFKFNENFSLIQFPVVEYNTNWKQCYNSLIDNNKNAYITGVYYDTLVNNYCFFLSKYDSVENLLWQQTLTDSYSFGGQILESHDGSIICGGEQSNNGNSKCLIASYKPNGENNWYNFFGKGSVQALAETPDSCILACGGYPGIQTLTDTYYDGCIRKINKYGELVWEKMYRNYAGHPTDEDWILSNMSVSSCKILSNNDIF